MKKLTALVTPAILLALAGCGGPSSSDKDAYLDWVHHYSWATPSVSDDELIEMGEGLCKVGARSPSANGMSDATLALAQRDDAYSEGVMAMQYAAIIHLCPEVGEAYEDPIPKPGEPFGPPA